MNLLDKISILCKDNNTTIAALEREIGISKGSICKWKTSFPKADNLAKVAEHLNVTTDYLLGLTDEKNKPTPEDRLISDFETGYDKLDADGKKLIDDLLKRLLSQQ